MIPAGLGRHQDSGTQSIVAYYDFVDELTMQNALVFNGLLVVVPAALWREMMEVCHAT